MVTETESDDFVEKEIAVDLASNTTMTRRSSMSQGFCELETKKWATLAAFSRKFLVPLECKRADCSDSDAPSKKDGSRSSVDGRFERNPSRRLVVAPVVVVLGK